jgi:multiple sugar transport system substrate-binding protein
LRLITLAAVPVLVLSACSGSSSTKAPSATGTAPASAPASVEPTTAGTATVRWFVGLGSGTQPNQIDAQRAFAAAYNKSQSNIVLKIEIVPNTNAYDVLKTEIAAGNAPDIIGPVGVKGRNGFEGLFLDMTPQIAANNYDLTQFPDALVKFFQQGGQGQVGLPYLIYPGYVFYNKDLFTKAGLADLPTTVGAQYNGQDWTWDTLSTIATQLTLDSANKKPTDAGFNADKIVQFGVDFQWADGRRMASCFAGGSFIKDDNKTAQIPAGWADAWNWYYDAMWKKHFAPTGKYISSTLLNNGTTVSSGRIAMDVAWGWSINSYGTAGKTTFKNWDIAVIPSYKGATSSPMDADTFTIAKATKNPDAAFKAMVAVMADKKLMQVYGGMPAAQSLQADYFAAFDTSLNAIFPGNKVTWAVLSEMAKYPATPSHEANMPAFLQVTSDYGAFYTKLQNTKDLDVAAELTALQATIQKDFDNAVITQL